MTEGIKQVGLMAGLVCGVLAALVALVYGRSGFSGAGAAFRSVATRLAGISFVVALLAGIGALLIPAGSGWRGVAAAAAAGLVIPALGMWAHLAAWGKTRASASGGAISAAGASQAPLVIAGLGLAAAGAIGWRYGAGAGLLQWMGLLLGGAASWLLIRQAAAWWTADASVREALKSADGAPAAWLAMVAVQAIFAVNPVLGVAGRPAAYWYPMLLSCAVFIGWLVSSLAVRVAPLPVRRAPLFHSLLILLIAGGLGAWASTMIFHHLTYFWPFVIGFAATGLLCGLMMQTSAGHMTPGVAGALGLFVILSALWAGFKFAYGTGFALVTLGLAAALGMAVPYALAHGDGIGRRLAAALQGAVTAGIAAVLWRVFVQQGDLIGESINLAAGGVFIALLIGLFAPLLLDGWLLDRDTGGKVCVFTGLMAWIGSLLLGLALLAGVGVFFGKTGVGAMMVGFVAAALLGIYAGIRQGGESPESRGAANGLWVAVSAAAVLLLPKADVVAAVSRTTKIEVLVVILVAGLLLQLFSGRRSPSSAP